MGLILPNGCILTLPPIGGWLHRSVGVLACGFTHRPRCVFPAVAPRTPPQPAAGDGRATGAVRGCARSPFPRPGTRDESALRRRAPPGSDHWAHLPNRFCSKILTHHGRSYFGFRVENRDLNRPFVTWGFPAPFPALKRRAIFSSPFGTVPPSSLKTKMCPGASGHRDYQPALDVFAGGTLRRESGECRDG
jgi:hypothetical protein